MPVSNANTPGADPREREGLPSAKHANDWLPYWAEQKPDGLAWADVDRRCNFAEAERRVARLAGWLAAQGVGRGDRVAIWLGNRSATLEALFAAARIGAIALPLNGRLTPIEIAFQLDDAQPSVIFIEAKWRGEAEAALAVMQKPHPLVLEVGTGTDADTGTGTGAGQDAYAVAIAESTPFPGVESDPEDAMILMYTSGTTGKPKGALLPHRKAIYNALNARRYFEISETDRVLIVAPLFHSLGLQILALPALYSGAGLVIQDGFDPARVWTSIEQERITYFGGVPTMHQRLLAKLDEGEPIAAPPASLRFAFTAGAAAPPELIRAFDRHGLMLKQGYGQTETSTLTCLDGERALEKAGSVGRPVHHAELRLITPATAEGEVKEWTDVGVGDVGEIVVRGPITMLGYWQRPEATSETLRAGWVRTGDLATRDADFDITLVGRAREMFISGGENVYPAEVEATLVEYPEIAEAAVVAAADPEWGEVGHAHLVLRPGLDQKDLDLETLRGWLEARLARFKMPRSFAVHDALPRTASGKVQKHLLPDLP
ncbi:MAG: class I adenylate-forming enzyme family protein [Myxococcota bacterium]